ncbi:MAG: D-glycero-beta-D-manno-heptose-7-phosphate kinase [Desulfobacterales bacterium]|jgi:D-beta-D-heptose 7-phosphate kinase/D-beta-D-heptose 1-phosphate adenosyltransferase
MDIDLSKFDHCHILVVGDLMIDEYLWGEVDRISPEAPVQVVSVQNEELILGGAGNVVNNLVALGAKVSIIGVVGAGTNGTLLRDKLDELGANTHGVITEPDRPTTRKTRIIAEHQQVLRIDRETKSNVSAQTFEAVAQAAENIIPHADVVLISDYGKGLITEALLSKLTKAAREHGKLTIADPKGLDFKKYSGINVMTPNKKEAALAAGIEIIDDATLFEVGQRLIQSIGIDKLIITCGKDGMVYFETGADIQKISTKARQVFDVSGAGDTVLAILGLAIASGMSFKDGVALANTAAGLVVGKVGTATVSKKELAAALQLIPADIVSKQISQEELVTITKELRKKAKRIVLTNGCFDLLHVGHIRLLAASKLLGDILIVAIDDDDSVRHLKGPDRPVISDAERVRIISALDSVDYVVVFSTGELDQIIEAARPNVLTKGSNYQSAEVYGREIVEQHGGQVELIPITEDISSTQIINNIKKK